MTAERANPLSIYISYAHEDTRWERELVKYLRALERQGLITLWHNRDIRAGASWENETNEQLNTAQIILALVSPDFMASDYCYDVEMKQAIERHKRREAQVIPIILRPVYWQKSTMGQLQCLPRNGTPVTTWSDLDEAFFDVAEGIRRIAEELSSSRNIASGIEGLHQEIITYPELSKHSSPWSKRYYIIAGKLSLLLKRYDAALTYYEKALYAEPYNSHLHIGKGAALLGLRRNGESLAAYEEAIHLAPGLSAAYRGQSKTYEQLAQQTYDELKQLAQVCHDKAKRLGEDESFREQFQPGSFPTPMP